MPEEAKQEGRREVLGYNLNGWTEIPNPITDDEEDLDVALTKANYVSIFSLTKYDEDKGNSGDVHPGGVSAEVYQKGLTTQFMVDVTMGGSSLYAPIYVDSLPALLELLSKLSPIVSCSMATLESEAIAEKARRNG